MAKAKHTKSKPSKQNKVKKQGKKQSVASEFHTQLDALGLKIIQVTSDGNCFFRSLGDQLEGNEEEHAKYRNMVVIFIKDNRGMFEPFIEDDIPFDKYCDSMEKDGTWAGNMELQAASLVTHSNICIHRIMSPRWYIRNFTDHVARMIHLSYHDGEHYNSVRSNDDSCTGPAKPITIKVDAEVSSKSLLVAATKYKGGPVMDNINARSIKAVMDGSGCENLAKVEQILREVRGDSDAAIEFLIAEKTIEECAAENGKTSFSKEIYHGEDQNGEAKLHSDGSGKASTSKDDNKASIDRIERIADSNASHREDKQISRNKACPCGSKKKYKSCCGTVANRSSNKFADISNHAVENGKGKTEKKHKKKLGANSNFANSHGSSDSKRPDLGALCI